MLEEVQEDALDRVLTPALLVRVGQRGLRRRGARDRRLERRRRRCPRSRVSQARFERGLVHARPVGDEVEELPRRLRLRRAEQVVHAGDDERDAGRLEAPRVIGSPFAFTLRSRTAMSDHDSPRFVAVLLERDAPKRLRSSRAM